MSDPTRPTLRAVDPTETGPPRRRGPGVAVIAVAVYALLFMTALWFFKARSKAPSPQAAVAEPVVSRASLLDGVGLPPARREKYLAALAAYRCDCGCEMTLLACLGRDLSCTRSSELAKDRMRKLSRPAPVRASAP